MTRNERHLKGASEAAWLFIRAGVAAAILKSKPCGMSGRERAEQLARGLRGREESWQHRAHGLQHELLRLQQELLITRGTSSTEAAGHGDTMDASQDLFGPGSETGCDSETPELMQLDPRPAMQPDPRRPAGPLPDPAGGAALPHVHFLQSLCALQRLREGERGLEALWFGPEGDAAGSLLAESVCRLLDSVVAVCGAPPPLLGAGEPVLQACRVAARAMDLFCSRRTASAEFTGHVEDSLRELTKLLLHRDQPSTLQSERLMEYVITLGSSSMSTSFLIRHLLSLISGLADQLQQSFQGQDSSVLARFPVVQYQNSCYLFWAVERLLQGFRLPCEPEWTGFFQRLQLVFLLSDEFPEFFICLWRLGCLLAAPADQRPLEPGPGLPPPSFRTRSTSTLF